MRQWLKNIIRECLREREFSLPFITANRAPTDKDIHHEGTTWKHGKDFYEAKESSTIWEKIE